MISPDETSWIGRAMDHLGKRVDALERIIGVKEGDPKIAGLGIGTWITFLGVVVVPIVVAILATSLAK